MRDEILSITTANITYNAHGTPVADAFDDVYFSNHDGMAETEHVFINNNALPARWLQHTRTTFTIAETGFGTGLNFLTTAHHFSEFRRKNPGNLLDTLHFISFEKFPIAQPDLHRSLQQWPTLSALSTQLLAKYPPAIAGCHRLIFQLSDDNCCNLTLDLWFGDVNELLPSLPDNLYRTIDTWFLDGFAPSKNPEMWQQHLFDNMAQLTRPNGTFATFTAAGFVKRGLQAAGFKVEKCRGFGRKRDMLRGEFPLFAGNTTTQAAVQEPSPKASKPSGKPLLACWKRTGVTAIPNNNTDNNTHHVAVIGGGLAGLTTAYALLRKGFKVTVLESANTLASGASGNTQGGFYPQLNVDFTLQSQLYSQCFYFAKQHYETLLANGFNFEHNFCGVLQLSFNESKQLRHQKLIKKGQWPATLIHSLTTEQAQQIAGIHLPCGGLFIPGGGWINPAQLVQALANACEQFSGFQCESGCNVTRLQLPEEQGYINEQGNIKPQQEHNIHMPQWHLTLAGTSATSLVANSVVLANSVACQSFSQCEGLTIQPVRGQVEHLEQANELGQLQTVLCHKGYITPAQNGMQHLGATFDKNQTDTNYRTIDEQRNLNTLRTALPHATWAGTITARQSGRASVRGATADHLPLMGNVPNLPAQVQQYAHLSKVRPGTAESLPVPAQWPNLFILAGLGSRGLCTAPLLAEALACQMGGNPLPLSQAQLNALSPNRFLIKQLKRGEMPRWLK